MNKRSIYQALLAVAIGGAALGISENRAEAVSCSQSAAWATLVCCNASVSGSPNGCAQGKTVSGVKQLDVFGNTIGGGFQWLGFGLDGSGNFKCSKHTPGGADGATVTATNCTGSTVNAIGYEFFNP